MDRIRDPVQSDQVSRAEEHASNEQHHDLLDVDELRSASEDREQQHDREDQQEVLEVSVRLGGSEGEGSQRHVSGVPGVVRGV